MKHIFLIIVAVCSFSVPSFATWLMVPLEELVQDSDLIVVGTLAGLYQHTQNGIDYGQGTILIDEVIWGAATAGDTVTLKWQNESGLICPRVEHRHNQRIRGIWLLTVEDGGVVGANNPGRFVDLGERTNVDRFLLKNKVCLRTTGYADADEPANISLVFRNPTQSPIEFPGIEYKDGRLLVDPNVTLTLYSRLHERRTMTAARANCVLWSQDLAPIIVEPQQEFRLTMDLRKLFDVVPEQNYYVRINVRGHGRANDVGFYSGPVASPRVDDAVQKKTTVPHTTPGPTLELLVYSIMGFAGTCFLAYRHRRRKYGASVV